MTFLEMQQNVHYLMRDKAFDTGGTVKYDNTYVKRWLNEAEKKFCSLCDYKITKNTSTTTVVGTQEYSLPTDFNKILALYYDGYRLPGIRITDTVWPTTSNGAPAAYYIRQTYFGIYPTPNDTKTVTIVYVATPGNMSDDSDSSVVPVEYQDFLVSYACEQCAIQGNDDRMEKFHQQWMEMLSFAKSQMAYRENVDDVVGGQAIAFIDDGTYDITLTGF